MNQSNPPSSVSAGTEQRLCPGRKFSAAAATLCCAAALGALLSACGPAPEVTQLPAATPEATTVTDSPSPVPGTEPIPETTAAPTAPPEPSITEPEPTETAPAEPVQTAPSMLDSEAYQRLLTVPNAEAFLCNEFGYNYLEIFAEWIESQDGLMEAYPERWHLKKYADGAAGLTIHSPLAEDNSCSYYYIYILDYNEIFPYPETGVRYFTDIPREDIAPLVYNATDPIGVDDSIKEAFIDYILYSDWFAWSVLEPEFQSEWYYETETFNPYPDIEVEQLRLCIDVWRPGMAEEELFQCYLIYDADRNDVSYGIVGNHDGRVLTGASTGN